MQKCTPSRPLSSHPVMFLTVFCEHENFHCIRQSNDGHRIFSQMCFPRIRYIVVVEPHQKIIKFYTRKPIQMCNAKARAWLDDTSFTHCTMSTPKIILIVISYTQRDKDDILHFCSHATAAEHIHKSKFVSEKWSKAGKAVRGMWVWVFVWMKCK